MNIFGIQIERIYKIKSPLPITYFLCYFKSIFQSPFMSRPFLILHRDSVVLLIYLMQCLGIYSITIPQFKGKYFSDFSNLQRNITSTERLFILDAVLRRAARLSKAFSTAHPSRPKNSFIRRSDPCYVKKSWHSSAQHGV